MLLKLLWCAVLLSVLHLSPRENEVFYDVVAIVDPLTREAQKMSPLLIVSCILLLSSTLSNHYPYHNSDRPFLFLFLPLHHALIGCFIAREEIRTHLSSQ